MLAFSDMDEIHEATAADVPEVATLIRSVLAEFTLEFGVGSATDAQVLSLPGSYIENGGCFWIARAGETLLGCAGVFPIDARIFELRKMYLHPRARGRGVGKRLLETVVAWAIAHGAKLLVLDTVEEMTRAIAFYEANGFVRDDSQIRGSRCTRGYARLLASE